MLVSTALGPMFLDDQGSAGEPVALLWPSLFTDHRMWVTQVTALRAAGWRTLAVDPPGHGQSPGPGRDFTMDECADAALELLDAVAPGAAVALLGTSWGGIVAPRIARRAPGRVRAMVLFNTTAEAPGASTRATSRLLTLLLAAPPLDPLVDRMLASMQLSRGTRHRRPRLGADLAARFRSWARAGLIRAVRSVLVDRDGILDALSGVAAPTLLVSGAEDKILPSPFSRRMAERLPHARHIEVPAAAHLVPLEQPDIANRLILDFLGEVRAGAAAGPTAA